MSKKKDTPYHREYMEAINNWMVYCERDRLETRIKRLLTARNKWRKRARIAEGKLEAIADADREIYGSRKALEK